MNPLTKAREVAMKRKKSKTTSAARIAAEVRRLVGDISESQLHFLRVAAAADKTLEPTGKLAG
jgi:hypothetical protein